MGKRKFISNPFNVLLVIAGAAFAVTAMAFGMMTLLAVDPQLSSIHTGDEHPLWKWLADYGDTMMFVEISVLAICALGIIVVDIKSE